MKEKFLQKYNLSMLSEEREKSESVTFINKIELMI